MGGSITYKPPETNVKLYLTLWPICFIIINISYAEIDAAVEMGIKGGLL